MPACARNEKCALEGSFVGVRTDTLVAINRIDQGHLIRGKLEAKDIEVLGHTLARVRLGEHDDAVLQVPTNSNLGG